MSLASDFRNGVGRENPTFRMLLGMCPTIATSLAISNGIGMGLAATFVLLGSNLIISIIRKVIPNQIRIPCFIVVIATFVTIVDLTMAAYLPELHKVLGVFVPLIVVNCIILARAEAFASKNPPLNSIMDGIGMGVGFTLALVLLSAIREPLGTGVILAAPDLGFEGIKLFPPEYAAAVVTRPVGGFITLGLLIGAVNLITMKRKRPCGQ
ncbi:MAG: electron transport complex subunit E [Firmicutes bacterium]|jgi:electron transport complex protein RnfE|nr:electron transport complex subunit E [Bacillota bacterium]